MSVGTRPTSDPTSGAQVETDSGARRRYGWWLALTGVLTLALALRVWGSRSGLPFVYNPDEYSHFVLRAVRFHAYGNLDPTYFVNPPAFSYVLYAVLGMWFGGSDAVVQAFAQDQGDVFLVARITAAVIGTVAVFLVYVAGVRFFDRRTGLLAAALFAVAFLPVFQAHQAVNDVPTLAPVALALVGIAGILRRERLVDYVLAGVGLGLACATKYPGGIVLLPLLVAAGFHFHRERGRASAGLGVAALTAIVSFLAANPFAAIHPRDFLDGIGLLSVQPEGADKFGQNQENGILYYLWVLTWGLGWVPAMAAAVGAAALFRDEKRIAVVLVPPVVLFVLFMGIQNVYFGRWLLPVFPFLVLLAAYGALRLAGFARRVGPRVGAAAVAVAAIAILAQGLVKSVHLDVVLSRTDSRNLARDWMIANIPSGTRIAWDPFRPPWWAATPGPTHLDQREDIRWRPYRLRTALRQLVDRGVVEEADLPDGTLPERISSPAYALYLRPELLDLYEERGVCWVVTAGSQSGRAYAEPEKAPGAIAYYRELERRAELVFRSTPFAAGRKPVPFNYDMSNNFYSTAYHRPGYEVRVYRLTGGECRKGD